MVNEYMFNEIMSMPSVKNCSLIIALDKMAEYDKNIKLLTTEKHEVFYQVNADTIRKMDINNEDLLTLNQSGWVLSENKKFLEYYI